MGNISAIHLIVRYGAVLALILLAPSGGALGAEKSIPRSMAEVQLSFAPLVKKAAPAVVNIYTTKMVSSRRGLSLFEDPFFRRFFGDQFGSQFDQNERSRRAQNSLGSGVIVGPDGVIVTNHHVIEGADEITVVLSDRREFKAEVLGTDERTDLAVLRIDAKGKPLPYLELRNSDELEVGDVVLAIGNPFGVGQTVTSGIVSALARTKVGISDLNFFIQTDAAINPGNSGGALVGLDGRLAGINSAIFSKSGGSQGIGFAVPSNMVRSVVAGVTKQGRLVRPWLGAWGQTVTAEIAQSLGMERPVGLLINDIYPNGPAARARLRVGDVLLAINGHELSDQDALAYRLSTLNVGVNTTLRVWRKRRLITARVNLTAPPEEPPRNITDLSGRHPVSGAKVANMSPALADELGITGRIRPGVIVLGIARVGTAARLGFRPGDRIEVVNGAAIVTIRDLKSALARTDKGWRITIDRDGEKLSLEVGP